MRLFLALAVILAAGTEFSAAAEPTCFPSDVGDAAKATPPLLSPDKKFEIYYVPSEKSRDRISHEAWVRRVGTAEESLLVELGLGGRNGCLLWSPDSRLVAYEYGGGSTGNEIGISRISDGLRVEPVPVGPQIESSIREIIGTGRRPHTIRYKLLGWSRDGKLLRIGVDGVGSVPPESEFHREIQVSVPASQILKSSK